MIFEIKALSSAGEVVVTRVDAVADTAARREMELRGMAVFQVRAVQPGTRLRFAPRSGNLNVLAFTQEMLMLLRAGLSMVAALEAISEKEKNAGARAIVESLLLKLRRGGRLSEALRESGGGFPAILIAGVSDESLQRYVDYASRLDEVRGKITAAMIYPVLLLVVGLLVTAFLIAFVVPRFASVYRESGGDMPWASALLFDAGRLIGTHPLEFASAALAGLLALVAVFSMRATRTWLGRRIRALPGVGLRVRIYELARLYRTLAMLLRGGTPIVPALAMASSMLSGAMREQLAQTSRQIAQGEPISRALESNGLTTAVGSRMLAVGERSGSMADMLARIADYHDEETTRSLEWLARLFEPLMMALLGIVIGGIVILLYMPIFDLAGSVQQ